MRHTGSGPGSFTNVGPGTGLRWVVVDITVQSGAIMGQARSGFAIYDSAYCNVFAQYQDLNPQGYYHWHGRQVWDSGDTWTIYSYDTGTTYRITGYELSLP